MVALLSETRCWRERTFFGIVFLNFTLAFTLAAWRTAPVAASRDARKISLVLWLMATLASLLTVPTPAHPGELPVNNKEQGRA
jgi:ABC-type thiamin/hydroxymethylpyrimidine transport system permease subunit